MKWKDACEASQDGKATRSTDDELWVILDPDTITIAYDTSKFTAIREEYSDALAAVYKLIFGSEGIEYEKVRYAWMKEMDKYEDWKPRKPKPVELQTAGATGANEESQQ
ncbi:MAG: hypothetical protein ACTSYO_08205 [Candidatus Ranarchaeia archaeon]